MKIESHIHTRYSKDSILKIQEIKEVMKRNNIIPIITDHDTIKGALKYKELYKECIVGEEITTTEGEIIGLFLKEKIKPGLSPEETAGKIREQGGLVYIPHPFDGIRKNVLKQSNLEIIKPDIMETFNRRSMNSRGDAKTQEYAISNKIPQIAASDAHTRFDLAKTFNILPTFTKKDLDSPRKFLQALKSAQQVTSKRTPFYIHIYGRIILILKKLEIL
ncbi:MAG: PHP domain-containing protein [Nanoarchaeota archaeon]|nr:PHP domain-containing protein [Nanoarchaeota archaeon]